MSKKTVDPKDQINKATESEEEIVDAIEEQVEEDAVKDGDKKKRAAKTSHRRLRLGSSSFAITAIVVVGVLLLNIALSILADKYPITIDLSEDQIYTMSDSSIAIAKSATKDIEIIIFTSEEYVANPTGGSSYGIPEYDTAMKEFYNILKQYKTYSNNRITYKFIDPNQDPALNAQYAEYEVGYGSILMLSADGQYRKITMDDLYTIDFPDNYSYTFESKVEKALGSKIHLLCGAKETLIQVLIGHDEDPKVIEGIRSVYEVNGYSFEEHNIIGSSDFSKEAEILLIAAPSNDYSAEEINRIKKWMYNDGNYGHHLMVYINPMAECPNLYELLEVDYQIRVEDHIVFETDMGRAYYYNVYDTLVDVPETTFTTNSASEGRVLMSQARHLTTTLGSKNEESSVNIYGLALTTHPISAGVALLDKLGDKNATAEEVIVDLKESDYPLNSTIAYVNEGYNNTTEQETYSTVIVCGSPTLAYADVLQDPNFRNEELILDMAASMVGSEGEVVFSTKDFSEERVIFDGNTQLYLGFGVFTLGLPAVIIIICLVVFIRRKNL